jgi:hypothetical protein
MHQEPSLIMPSTNRNLLQPTKGHKSKRQKEVEAMLEAGNRQRTSSSPERSRSRSPSRSHIPIIGAILGSRSPSSDSAKSDRSQRVDLIIEDTRAEETERVRARKEGSARWNEDEPRIFM